MCWIQYSIIREKLDMEAKEWIYCPVCENKTRIQVLKQTELKSFPLFWPKCKKETLIDVKAQKVSVITEAK